MGSDQPGTPAASGKMLQVFDRAATACTEGGDYHPGIRACCRRAGIAAVRSGIEAEARADERRKIADRLEDMATSGLEGELVASAFIHVAQMLREDEL